MKIGSMSDILNEMSNLWFPLIFGIFWLQENKGFQTKLNSIERKGEYVLYTKGFQIHFFGVWVEFSNVR